MTVIGALDDRVGLRHYDIVNQSNNSDTFIEFLSKLIIKLNDQPATLVLDNLGVHHSKKVQAFMRNHPQV